MSVVLKANSYKEVITCGYRSLFSTFEFMSCYCNQNGAASENSSCVDYLNNGVCVRAFICVCSCLLFVIMRECVGADEGFGCEALQYFCRIPGLFFCWSSGVTPENTV